MVYNPMYGISIITMVYTIATMVYSIPDVHGIYNNYELNKPQVRSTTSLYTYNYIPVCNVCQSVPGGHAQCANVTTSLMFNTMTSTCNTQLYSSMKLCNNRLL